MNDRNGADVDLSDQPNDCTQRLGKLQKELDVWRQVPTGWYIGSWTLDCQTGHVERDRGWYEMLGYNPDCPGFQKTLEDWQVLVHPEDKAMAGVKLQAAISDREKKFDSKHRLQHKNGDYVWIHSWAIATEWTNDKPLLLQGKYLNIDAQMKAEQELRDTWQRSQLALEGARLGFWVWYISTGKVIHDARSAEILGCSAEELGDSIAKWKRLIAKEDRERVKKKWDDLKSGRESVYMEKHRVRTKDGNVAWVLNRGSIVQRDQDGKPLLAAGAYINVTGHKNLEAGFQRIADNLAAGIFHVTDKEVFTFCNRTFRDWHDVNESVHRSGDHFLRDIVNSYTYGQMHPHIDKILRQESVREKDVYEDAAGRFIEADYRPDTEGDSEGPKGVFVLLTDVTRRESLYESTRMISSKPDLDEKLKWVVHAAKERLKADIAHISLRHEGTNTFYMHFCLGATDDDYGRLRRPIGAGMGRDAIQTRKPVICHDYCAKYEPQPDLRAACEREGIKAGIAAPIIFSETAVGVLYVFNRGAKLFEKADANHLAFLANLAGIEIVGWKLRKSTDSIRDLAECINDIVDEEVTRKVFYTRLIKFLLKTLNCRHGAYVSFEEGEGVFVGHPLEDAEKKTDVVSEEILLQDLGDPRKVKRFFRSAFRQRMISDAQRADADDGFDSKTSWPPIRFFNDSKSDPEFHATGLARVHGSNEIMVIAVSPAPGKTTEASTDSYRQKEPEGCLILYDKREKDGRFTKWDEQTIIDLPLSSIIASATEMPFRLHEGPGGLVKSVLNKIGIKEWVIKERAIKNFMDLAKLAMLFIAICFIAIPLGQLALDKLPWIERIYPALKGTLVPWLASLHPGIESLLKRVGDIVGLLPSPLIALQPAESPVSIRMLHSVEMLVMLLTFVIFAMGLTVLWKPRYASGLPRWIRSFTHLAALKSTILTLVVILVSIAFLQKYLLYLDTWTPGSILELVYFSLSPSLLILAIAMFIKLGLIGERTGTGSTETGGGD